MASFIGLQRSYSLGFKTFLLRVSFEAGSTLHLLCQIFFTLKKEKEICKINYHFYTKKIPKKKSTKATIWLYLTYSKAF